MKKKIIIVVSHYYKDISKGMIENAIKSLKNFKIIKIIKVPGVFEIPISIVKNINKADAFVALGCVIKGETPHFTFISQAVTQAIMNISIDYKKPIGNGIITCLNKKQAMSRLKKGKEASKAIISILTQN